MKSLSIILLTFLLIIFGINNTQHYVLSFLDYQLMFSFPLWALIMVFFFAGMVPLFLTGISERVAYNKRMREMNRRIEELSKKKSATGEETAGEDSV